MSEKKSDYFNMSEALDELRFSFGAGETAKSGLKLLGKGLFNVARFGVTEVLPGMTEKMAKQILENEDITLEQREKAEKALSSADAMRQHYKTGRYKEEQDDD
jgi:hypothetical protein